MTMMSNNNCITRFIDSCCSADLDSNNLGDQAAQGKRGDPKVCRNEAKTWGKIMNGDPIATAVLLGKKVIAKKMH